MVGIYTGLENDVPIPPRSSLRPKANEEENTVEVSTEDGYLISFAGEREEWTVRDPEGKTTRIWGDPHVVEADGDKWDFTEDTTFVFGENKITVQTTPIVNGASYSDTVSIYNGSDRVTVTDIDSNRPKIEAWSLDAQAHDASIEDGDIYTLSSSGDSFERSE
jgi:hypothetical protein